MTMTDKLRDMLSRGYVTPLDALKEAGCLSLSQRVGELIREGLAVEKKWVDLDNGKRVRAYRIA